MTVSKGLGTYGDGAGVVTPTDHKVAHLGLVSKTGAGSNTVRPGLFFDGVTTIVTGAANMSYNVAPFTAVSSRGGSAGAVFFANDGVVNVATTAAPGTDSRIDVVYVWQREFSLDGGTTAPVIGVVQGAVAASPVAPSLSAFPGAIELARITVPAGVTATNSGATITQTAPFTALDGAPIPVRNAAGLPTVAVAGSRARTIDTGVIYEWSGSAWTIPPIGLRQTVKFVAAGAFAFDKATYPWLRAIRVRAQGGGGGSAGHPATAAGQGAVGSPGGGGAYAEFFTTDIAGLAASVTVTVGAGGAAGASGGAAAGAGGASSFGTLCSAGGGGGGVGGAIGVAGDIPVDGGAGGTAVTGDFGYSGEAGETAFVINASWHRGTKGGNSPLTMNAIELRRANGGTRAALGVSTNAYGCGAHGPSAGASQAAQAGAAGAGGLVILELFA